MANLLGKTLLGLIAATIAAGSLAAQDPESTFAEGIKSLRLGNREEALAKFQAVLAADPSHEQAFEIWRKTDQDMWRWLMMEQGEIAKIAQEMQTRAKLRRKELSRDTSAIDALVEKAVAGENFGERRAALNQLMADHGEFAVPALVKKLGNADDSNGQNQALLALHALGSVATLPLIEAMRSENALVRRNAAAVLSHIADERALPALLDAAANDASESVRYVADRAAKRMSPNGGNPAEAYVAQAERYLLGRDGGVVSDVVWNLKDGALEPAEVPSSIFHLRVAQKFAHAAFRVDPASGSAKAIYARALLAEAAAIDAALTASGDAAADSLKALSGRPADLRVKAVALGPTVLRTALADARGKGMAPVAVECAQLLGTVEDKSTVGNSTLLAGMEDDDKRVAYACALAISKATGGVNVPQADKVVAVLGAAATEESLRTILVIDGSEGVRRTAREAFVKGRGTVVEAAATGIAAVGALVTFPTTDVVVINQDLPDVVPEHVIGLIRKDPRMANTKIVVVATDVEKAQERFGDRVNGVVKGPLSGADLNAKVSEVLDGVDLGSKRKWADLVATEASSALAAMASQGLNVGAVAKELGAQLNRADAVSIPAAKALAQSGTSADLAALVAAITGSGSAALKGEAANAVGSILQRAGSPAASSIVDSLTAAIGGADGAVRQAIVSALGRANLASGDQLKLLDAIEKAMSAAPAKTEEAGGEAKTDGS